MISEFSNFDNELCRHLFEHSPAGAAVVSPQFRFLSVNKAFSSFSGYTEEELLLLTFADITHPDSIISDKKQLKKLLNGEIDQYTTTKKYIHKKGHCIWGNVSVRIFRDASGSPLYFLPIIIDITDKMNAEEQAIENETRFKMVFELAADTVIIADPQGKILNANERSTELTGYSIQELAGKDLSHLFSKEEMDKNPLRFDMLYQGCIEQTNRILKRKDGNSLLIEMTSRMMPDKSSQTIMRDITEREKAHSALKFSEEKFSKVFNLSPDSININRLSDGVYLDINNGFVAMSGFSREEVLGKSSLPGNLGIWVNKRDRETLVEGLKKHGEVIDLEAPFRRKDGSIIYGMMSAKIMEINGEACILSITRDITERKMQIDALSESEKRFRELANSLPLGIYESDLSGQIIFVNDTALEWFQYTPGDIKKGLNILQTVSPQDRAKGIESMQRVLLDQNPKPVEYNAIRKDGTQFPVLIISRPIRNEDGTPEGYRGTVVDITERQKIELALQNTQKLESLGVLAGGIAHDFNNLLAGIFGYVDLARNKLDQLSEERNFLDGAISVFSRAKALTHQLLTFAKGGTPVKTSIAIPSILEETVYFSLSGSNIKAKFDIPENIWSCNADMHQISQVIDNVIINARQAMPLGGEILITASNEVIPATSALPLTKGNYIKITIKDSGIGIPKEILPRIFDPFFTTKQQGSGLGLTTSFSIVKKHNGHIFAESEQSQGTTFTIYLPAEMSNISRHSSEGLNTINVLNKRILFMDDEEFICDIATFALNEVGCSAVIANDGYTAINLYMKALSENQPFDAVIFDLTIPGSIGGSEVLTELRKLDPAIIAIASSGYSDDPVMANPEHFGFKSKLVKPYLKHDLQIIIEQLFTKNS
jgi:PAS domain S-box-containing protein